jgi:alpha-beta hydrolase superfamily lysophospholipase
VLRRDREAGERAGRRKAPPTTGRRVRRVLLVLVLVVALLLASACGLAAWRVSTQATDLLTVQPTYWSSQVEVDRVSRDRITITQVPGGPTWLRAGKVYGLTWKDGWGRVGAVTSDRGTTVEREFTLEGGRPPRAGERVRYSRESYPRDAREAFPDEKVRQLELTGPAGKRLPAWFVPGRSRTWAVLVHGRGSARSEMFRLMRDTMGVGMPSLDITYRGDPETGGGKVRLGLTEWRDVQTAVREARKRGARKVVLVGASMGGSLIASFLRRSDDARMVSAVVLDAPLLDFGSAVRSAAEKGTVPGLGRRLPGWLASVGVRLTSLRSGVDLGDADYLDDTSWLTVPCLVLQGENDDAVPPADTQRFAAAERKLVELQVFPGAGHVESWNMDPSGYDRRVRDFLKDYVDTTQG